ncbi:hypothetical protein RHGRI_010418 [Rhododendron griersonianum]|uniref:AAA+ ATPase domain-containing protein n=1 Tax=Rhododendron griersonianum TaxID=479676 RepID=A0AAV6KJB0_9ERIC|nr:hypothetical protein RHGRI_010418 [Rhododendron griersonianum]
MHIHIKQFHRGGRKKTELKMCTPQGIIEKLGCLAFDEAAKAAIKAGKYVIHYMTNLEKLQAEMRSLKDRSEIVEENVRVATHRGEEVYNVVLHWRTEADGMTHDVRELVGQSSGTGNMSCFACSCPNIKRRYRLSKQAEEKIAGVQKLIQDSHFDEISHARPPPPELEFPSNKDYINLVSREPVFKDIVDALKDPSVNVIGVHGLGGVGKTTLVEEVGKKMRHDGTFKQVPLAVVPKDLNVKEIQSKLADRLDIELDAKSDEKGRATKLWNKFSNGEKYLVILDDIWEEVDITAIGIPLIKGSTTGCKVLLTSRNENLLTRMKVDRSFPIAELPTPEAWTLFKKLTGNSIDESRPEIYSLAKKVCEKCKGLPVAINALGAALKDKPDHAWKNALDHLERSMITNIEGINPSVWASLKLSYDMLWSSDAKSCFLICCLFPKDVETTIDDLARHCLTMCLLSQNPDTLAEARDAVRALVGSLKSASLLSNDNDENVVRMHDVIRDVGISIARKEEAFLINHGAVRWPRNPINGTRYSAISLRAEKIKRLPNELTCPQLHTLMFVNSKFSHLEVPDNFFSEMKQLTVLILCRMSLQQLPSSLAKLASLGMLCLEHCELEDIAILGDLKTSLEVLSLRGSTIKALPQAIEKLTNLLLLDLRDCTKLKFIPRGVISNLTSLEELYLPDTFDQWEATDHKRQDTSIINVTLEELRWSLSTGQLTTLHIYVPDVMLLPKEGLNFENLKIFRISVGLGSKYKNLPGKRVFICVRSSLPNEFIPLVDKAESLYLENSKGLKKLFHDRGVGNRFLDLKYIEVISCDDYLEYLIGEPKSFGQSHGLHPSKSFNNLIEVIVEHCKLKYLFSPSSARGLVHLKKLKVEYCEIMEEIIGFEGQNDEDELTSAVNFSKLSQLQLTYLPNLISFYAKKEKTRTTMGSSSAPAQPLFNEKVILPVLERLFISRLGNIIEIWDKQSIAVLEDKGSFCQLTDVSIKDCGKLLLVFPPKMHPQLKNLEKLQVYDCVAMEGIVEFEGEIYEDGLGNEVCFSKLSSLKLAFLPNLVRFCTKLRTAGTTDGNATIHAQPLFNEKGNIMTLVIRLRRPMVLQHLMECNGSYGIFTKEEIDGIGDCGGCGQSERGGKCREKVSREFQMVHKDVRVVRFKSGPITSVLVIFPVLEELTIYGLDNIIKIWDNQSIAVMEERGSFCQLTTVYARNCNKLMHALSSKTHPLLKNLEVLRVYNCGTMKSITEFEGEIDEDGLRNEVASPALEHLEMFGAPKITEIQDKQPIPQPRIEVESLSKLERIEIWGCDQLLYVFPSNMLPQNLQQLDISYCDVLEVIFSKELKEKEAINYDIIVFPQLKIVTLRNLPKLKSFFTGTQGFFSHKVAFPVLEMLIFENLDKITRIWDNQPLPESEKEAKSFCQLMDISVSCCVHLEYVLPFYMLPRLKNLQELTIRKCTKMEVIISNNLKDQKEATINDTILFPQLKTVELKELPNLKSLCTETQLFFSNKDAFPVLKTIKLDPKGTLEFLRNEMASTKEVSMEVRIFTCFSSLNKHLNVVQVAKKMTIMVNKAEDYDHDVTKIRAKVRQQAADLISRSAVVMKQCQEEQLMGHLGVVLYEYLGEEYPEVLGSILGALKAVVNVIGMTKMTPPVKDLLPRLTPILKNRHEKVQENCIDLVGQIADRGAEFVPAREWMRICFELLEMLKAHKKGIRRATVNTFGYIAKAIGPQDVLATLLNNLKVQERQNRVCTTVAIAIVAETCSPFTVLPALMNEYRVQELNVQNGVLKSFSFLFEYIGEMGKDYIYAVTPLLEDALMDRDLVHRQTAASAVKHMALGVAGLGCEDALIHLLNYVWPNIFEISPHVINAIMEAIEGMRVAMGVAVVLNYCLQGLFHPARKVREVYWKIYNSLYIGAQDALVAAYPVLEDEEQNIFSRPELTVFI